MKAILLIFGTLTRFVFEWGVIALAWMLWGWNVGLAFLLWYILWTMTGLTLVKALVYENEQKEREQRVSEEQVKESFRRFARILEEAKKKFDEEKKDVK